MKDFLNALQALQDTPVPNLLVIGGFILLILAFAGKVGAFVELPPNRQKWAGIIGVFLLVFGIGLFALPELSHDPMPTQPPPDQVVPETGCIPMPIAPETGAILDNGRTDGADQVTMHFDWSDCPGAREYHLMVGPISMNPVIDQFMPESFFDYVNPGASFTEEYLNTWAWKVRPDINGQWTPWSEERTFEIEPINTDPPQP